MSASLVGSEMCIRDRCRSVAPYWPSSRVSREITRLKLSGAPRSSAELRGCLLYTSDAADDM
eukprot:13500910-Alexandrium_andersonii.AAC.1